MAQRRRSKVTPEVEAMTREYHQRGYSIKDIVSLLEERGVVVSYSHMKNIVIPKRLRLCKRRANRADPLTVAEAVLEATRDGSAAAASASSLTQFLRVNNGLNTVRADVLDAQRLLDPDSVQQRRTGRLHCRAYASEGPNQIWHCDGYDKLAPFGFPIHGCIDGFSRFLLWLELAPTNRRPEQTCHFFLRAVRQYGLPETIRVDAGTENTNIKWAQRFLCQPLPRRFDALPPVLVGSSNHNERIERFWGCLRTQNINWWINHFKAMAEVGHIVPWDNVDRKVAYYVYEHRLRNELDQVLRWHNDHLIRSQKNPEILRGKPTIMYELPHRFNRRECKLTPAPMDLAMATHRMAQDLPFDHEYGTALQELVTHSGMVYPPRTMDEADEMYPALRTEMHAIIDVD